LTILNIVLPIFLMIGLGWALRRLRFISAADGSTLSRLIFHVAAPALLLRSAAQTPLSHSLDPRVIGVMAGGSAVYAAIVYLTVWRMRPGRRGVFAQGVHRSNMVFFGLPLIMGAYGREAVGQVSVLVAVMVIVYNLLAVFLLTLPHRRRGEDQAAAWIDTGRNILLNPLALACVAGVAMSALGLRLPAALDTAVDLVGRTALPLALVSIGAGLDLARLRIEIPITSVAIVLKLGLYPALIYAALRALGVSGVALSASVLLAATPTAVVSYVMAREMRGDSELAGAMVIGTTLASLATTVVWLLVLGV